MEEYAKTFQKVTIRRTAENVFTFQDRVELASVIGQLNWMSRQGRYDLSYGVSHVQQLAANKAK